jgi:V/A-type H+-transporting ATPase subunit I
MSALLLSQPERMYRVRVIAPRDRGEEVLAALQRAGTLHVREAEAKPESERPAVELRIREIGELAHALDEIISRAMPRAPQAPPMPAEGMELVLSRPFEEAKGRAIELASKFRDGLGRISALEGELRGLRELRGHLSRAGGLSHFKLRDLSYEGEYLFSMVVVAKAESWRRVLEDLGKELLLYESFEDPEGGVTAYLMARATAKEELRSELRSKGAEALSLPREEISVGDYLLRLGERIESLEGEISKIEDGFRGLVPDWSEALMLRWAMEWELDRLSVLLRAFETSHLVAIEGWVPESGLERTSKELGPLGYAYYDYEEADPGEEPPTKLRNRKGVRPFEVIINFFGVPKYTEWDPTPITAYSFAIFYGIMLGDVLYGLGLILAAKLILKKLVDDPEAEGFKLFRNMLYICGGAAMSFGMISGSYLGDAYELLGLGGVVRPLASQLTDPFSFIVISLALGLIHVNTAHMLSTVRGFREGNRPFVIGRVGFFMAEAFGIVYVLYKFFGVELLPLSSADYSKLLYPTLAGVAILIVAMILQNGGLGALLWVFELAGLMGDVLSYSRLAGVSMASFFLASAFNKMAAMVFGGVSGLLPGMAGLILGGALSILMAAFSHILNFALSSLGAFIHSMRLCFVEFLPKFYYGEGKEYKPFRMRRGPA